jgi:hypothetical protein
MPDLVRGPLVVGWYVPESPSGEGPFTSGCMLVHASVSLQTAGGPLPPLPRQLKRYGIITDGQNGTSPPHSAESALRNSSIGRVCARVRLRLAGRRMPPPATSTRLRSAMVHVARASKIWLMHVCECVCGRARACASQCARERVCAHARVCLCLCLCLSGWCIVGIEPPCACVRVGVCWRGCLCLFLCVCEWYGLNRVGAYSASSPPHSAPPIEGSLGATGSAIIDYRVRVQLCTSGVGPPVKPSVPARIAGAAKPRT